MYGLPNGFDPRVFVGRRLSAVTFAENLISVAFEDDMNVTVLGSILHRDWVGAEECVDSPPVSRTSLVSLVGRTVVSAVVRSPKELVLRFEGGGSVTLLDESENYESFIIKFDEREIIV